MLDRRINLFRIPENAPGRQICSGDTKGRLALWTKTGKRDARA